MKIALSFQLQKQRQREFDTLCKKGILAAGFRIEKIYDGDCLITWGAHRGNAPLIKHYRDEKRPVLIMDLGYWGRKTWFKVSLNQLHPPAILKEKFTGARYEKSGGIPIEPAREGGNFILLAAMGPKGCAAYAQDHGAWDAWAYKQIQKHTDMRVVWKVKPSDQDPILPLGVKPFTGGIMLSDYPLEKCAAIVTHHGNCAVEALARGIPAFCVDGAAAEICDFDLAKIGSAILPENRVQFLHNLAHWQWDKNEIASGQMFLDYQKRGLI